MCSVAFTPRTLIQSFVKSRKHGNLPAPLRCGSERLHFEFHVIAEFAKFVINSALPFFLPRPYLGFLFIHFTKLMCFKDYKNILICNKRSLWYSRNFVWMIRLSRVFFYRWNIDYWISIIGFFSRCSCDLIALIKFYKLSMKNFSIIPPLLLKSITFKKKEKWKKHIVRKNVNNQKNKRKLFKNVVAFECRKTFENCLFSRRVSEKVFKKKCKFSTNICYCFTFPLL